LPQPLPKTQLIGVELRVIIVVCAHMVLWLAYCRVTVYSMILCSWRPPSVVFDTCNELAAWNETPLMVACKRRGEWRNKQSVTNTADKQTTSSKHRSVLGALSMKQ
jgi:hypothetical protein